MHAPQPSPAVRLKDTEFRERAAAAGLNTEAEIANHLGMHRISVWRILTGEAAPGIAFLAAVLASFPGITFEDVFEVVVPRNFRTVTRCQRCAA